MEEKDERARPATDTGDTDTGNVFGFDPVAITLSHSRTELGYPPITWQGWENRLNTITRDINEYTQHT